MLLDRARHAYSEWKARPASFSFVREGKRRQRRPGEVGLPDEPLKILSFNVQAGIGSQRFRDYITGSWKHLVGHSRSREIIEQISEVVSDYDLVALQEVDGGSLRSKNLNQVVHLASLAEFPFWHQQLNRNLGRFGQFSNGLLSRVVPYHVEDHRLPGLPGRGAIIAKYGHPDAPLVLVAVHLALGERYRNAQLEYLREHLADERHVIVLGDFNCRLADLDRSPFADLSLQAACEGINTYPSWAPDRHIDHILVTPSLEVTQTRVLEHCTLSDHLPLATHIRLPPEVLEAATHAPIALT
ncbi:MAG: endonuclease/exonuclease/phosphatase family protein [Alcanivoracaceae bacterium]|jgi:endonuclease/exonuclease/phosphatase family metal-dependent hydrolase|nr:endonuclease/exonuclease/phosphatase family protein [Alcanivoracaceae bacterium]